MNGLLISTVLAFRFLNKNSYPIYLPEALCFWALLFAGFTALEWSCARLGKSWIFYALTVAFLVDFVIGSQSLALASFLATYLLRSRISRLFFIFSCIALAVVIVSSFLNPVFLYSSKTFQQSSGTSVKKPHVFVFILDEHGGLVDYPDIAKSYADKGFEVYPRAYSNYNAAWASICSLLNASTAGRQALMQGIAVKQNALFKRLSREGYPIYIYQNPHVDFSKANRVTPKKVFKYQEDSAGYLAGLGVSLRGKVWVLFNNFIESHKSRTAIKILRRFQRPENGSITMTGALAIGRILEEVEADAAAEKNGGFFFAHIHNPHSHYVYKANGELLDPLDWEPCHSEALDKEGTLNTAESWKRKHALASGQIYALHRALGNFMERLKARGLYEQSTFIFISNYGSHIYRIHANVRNKNRLTAEEYKDGYSVLLALKNGGFNKEWPVDQGKIVQAMTPASLVLADYFHFTPESAAGKEALKDIYLPTDDPFLWERTDAQQF